MTSLAEVLMKYDFQDTPLERLQAKLGGEVRATGDSLGLWSCPLALVDL